MTEADKLKTLIENLDQGDSAVMNEINVNFAKLLGWTVEPWIEGYSKWRHAGLEPEQWLLGVPSWTTSLDALKAVQDEHLEGVWLPSMVPNDAGFAFQLSKNEKPFKHIVCTGLPTMHLAWLHALIQAIEWKRQNEGESWWLKTLQEKPDIETTRRGGSYCKLNTPS